MGRARKPLDAQSGDLTVERQQQRAAEQQFAEGNAFPEAPPKALADREAVNLWKWAVEQIKAMPLLGSVDALNVEGMCNAFALYRKATARIKKEGLFDEEGAVNPAMAAQKKYAEEYRAFARLCGFTVDSRLKLAAIKVKEMDNDIEDTFGDV